MAFKRSRRPAFAVASRRATEWAGGAGPTTLTVLAATTKLLDSSFSEATLARLVPATIVREHMTLYVKSDQIAASENPFGSVGSAVVSEQARVAGAASLPGPDTNDASDLWYLHGRWSAVIVFGTAVGLETSAGRVFQFDSKAQRKVEDGSAIVTMIENITAFGVQYLIQQRTLFKLH